MAGGRIWGTMFFIFMSFAAMSTIIAVFEAIIAANMDLTSWERTKAVKINIVALILLSMPAILGYNLWSGFTPFADGTTIMDLEDFIVSYNVLPLGSLIFVLFCVKKNGWGFDNFLKEANTGSGINFPAIVKGYMNYVLPLIIVVVYLKGYYDMFAGMGTKTFVFWMFIACLLLAAIFYFSRDHVKEEASLLY
jgi:NSS family neurotransmitter:Na+ symporter